MGKQLRARTSAVILCETERRLHAREWLSQAWQVCSPSIRLDGLLGIQCASDLSQLSVFDARGLLLGAVARLGRTAGFDEGR